MEERTIIRAAVIGMGNMGSQYAALLAAGAVPGMELAAVTRVRPETLAARGLTLPAALPVYQTADELFAAVDAGALALDAVIIATPHRLHEPQAAGAMGRGYMSTALPAAPMDYNLEAPIRAGGVFGSIMQTAIPAAD